MAQISLFPYSEFKGMHIIYPGIIIEEAKKENHYLVKHKRKTLFTLEYYLSGDEERPIAMWFAFKRTSNNQRTSSCMWAKQVGAESVLNIEIKAALDRLKEEKG